MLFFTRCPRPPFGAILGGLLAMASPLAAQDAVDVTMVAGQSALLVGQTTTVTVSGRIDPAIEEQSEQIFSWHIDLCADTTTVVSAYENVRMPASDNGGVSGDGTIDGTCLRGIYDLFTGNAGAGKGSPVVLAQFEVTALAPGTVTFSAQPGTTGPFSNDFVVSKTGGGSFTGGNYDAASVTIAVGDLADLMPTIARTGESAFLVTFAPLAGFDHTLQSSPDLSLGSWIDLPGAPHNEGNVLVSSAGVPARYFRVRVASP